MTAGTEVDEDQIRQAIYRIRRLPFVIDADFSLRKGSERGRFELVIRIERASSFFLDLEGLTEWRAGGSSNASNEGELFWSGSLGARYFLGSRGYAFGSIDRFENVRLGYTQFHLFDAGSYLSVSLFKNFDEASDFSSASLSAGKPITARQTVRLVGTMANSELIDRRTAALEWAFDSTDDPILPTRGATLSASASLGESTLTARFGDGFDFRSRTAFRSIAVLARAYRPLSKRQSVWGELSTEQGRTDSEVQSNGFSSRSTVRASAVGVGYAWDLLRSDMVLPVTICALRSVPTIRSGRRAARSSPAISVPQARAPRRAWSTSARRVRSAFRSPTSTTDSRGAVDERARSLGCASHVHPPSGAPRLWARGRRARRTVANLRARSRGGVERGRDA